MGSANLTLGGLNNNIEAGMLIDFDMSNEGDKTVETRIEDALLILPGDYPDHIEPVSSIAELDEKLPSGRLVDEMATPPRPTTSIGNRAKTDNVRRIELKVKPLGRDLERAKSIPERSPVITPAVKEASTIDPFSAAGVEFEQVWESKLLTWRDLTIPTATGTHATGSVNLDKRLLAPEVDHRHYFRDDVFTDLVWTPETKTVDEAYAKFHLIVKGVSCGEFDLLIRHSHSATSKTCLQRNAVYRLSWGPVRTYVAREDLIGGTLVLYRDKVDTKRFILEID